MNIITNNQYRDIKYNDNGEPYFTYKGEDILLGDIMRLDSTSQFDSRWSGYRSDSFFSGILVQLSNDCDSLIVATYIS